MSFKEQLTKSFLLISLLFAAGDEAAFAQHDIGRPPSGQTQDLPASPKNGKGSGVIQKINQGKGVVTIKHGPLQGIIIPAATNSFLIKDKTMLSNLQPLQKVDFELIHENGIYVITKIR